MKKVLLTLLLLASFSQVKSQILFQETFDNISGSQAGGAGTYAFPSGWTLVNVDNRTPDAAVAYVNEAWERREDFANNTADSAAFSTSWYNPVGASDDWMWTPAIGPLPSNSSLNWNALTYDVQYPDGYEVRIMAAPDVPTGGPGNLGNMVSNSSLLFSISAENTVWTPRTVNLSAYTGQIVYIGFRNNSNNQFILLIDDVVVESLIANDGQLISIEQPSEYTRMPINQAALNLGGSIRNGGIDSLTNLNLNVEIYDATNTIVYTAAGTATDLAAGDTASFSITPFTPTSTGEYSVKYFLSCTEIDGNNSNDTLLTSFTVSDTVYARDNEVISGNLGIGAGNGGFVGQDFVISNTDELTSITIRVSAGYTGRQLALAIWDFGATTPNAIIAGTDTITYPDDSARIYTIPIHGGPFTLNPGRYAITAIEFDSTLAVSLTTERFTPGTTWVNWPTSPLGGWGNNEDFGPLFSNSYYIRANFGVTCNLSLQSSVTDASCAGTTDGEISLNVNGAANPVTYDWSPAVSTGSTATGIPAGNYTVVVTDANNCSTTDTFTVNEPAAIDNTTTVSGFTITANQSGATYQWIDCTMGSPISGQTGQSFTATADGDYSVEVTVNNCTVASLCESIIGTGISSSEAAKALNVYPNPSSALFSVKAKSAGTFTIHDNIGQLVKTITLNAQNNFTVTVDDLRSGVYSISGLLDGKTVKQHIVIQR